MKTLITARPQVFLLLISLLLSFMGNAQGGWNPELEKDSKEALDTMKKDSPKLETFANKAYGYAIFPKVTKAGLGIGGAAGKGIVYKGTNIVGSSKLK